MTLAASNSISSNGDNSDASHSTPFSILRSVCYNPTSISSVVQSGHEHKRYLGKHDDFSNNDNDTASAMH